MKNLLIILALAILIPAVIAAESEACNAGTFALPKVKFEWSWSSIEYNACDEDNIGYIYCDAAQFSIELLEKVQMFKESKLSSQQLHFSAFLIKDGYSEDFQKDFDYYFRNVTFFDTPSYYIDDEKGLWKLFSDPSLFIFNLENKQLSEPGLYDIQVNIEGEKDAISSIEVTFAFVGFNPEDGHSLFYYLPFDGDIGIENGIHNRNGYGLSYENQGNFYLNSDLAIQQESSTGGLNSLMLESVRDTTKIITSQDKGQSLVVQQNSPNSFELKFIPTFATPLMLSIEHKLSDKTPFSVYYQLLEGLGAKTVEAGQKLTTWVGISRTCADFDEGSIYEKSDRVVTSADNANLIGNLEGIYALDWDDVKAEGDVFLKTIFYTPVGGQIFLTIPEIAQSNSQLYSSAEFITTSTTGSNIALNGVNGLNFDNTMEFIRSLSDLFSAVENELMCVKNEPDKVTFSWNEKLLYSVLESKIREAEQTCIEAKMCEDETSYNECSITKPKFCSNGELIDRCQGADELIGTPDDCGCEVGYDCQEGGTCSQPMCSDGTLYEQCSATKPKYCDKEGNLIDNCNICGCLENQKCQEDGKCEEQLKPIVTNIKNSDKYKPKQIFLTSDKDWANVLPLVSLSTWSNWDSNQANVRKYPVLIYHEEENFEDINNLWYSDYNGYLGNFIYQVDTFKLINLDENSPCTKENGCVVASFRIPPVMESNVRQISELAYDGTYLWALDTSYITRINPKKGMEYGICTQQNDCIMGQTEAPGNAPQGLTYGGTYLWSADYSDENHYGRIYQIDRAILMNNQKCTKENGCIIASFSTYSKPLETGLMVGGIIGLAWNGYNLLYAMSSAGYHLPWEVEGIVEINQDLAVTKGTCTQENNCELSRVPYSLEYHIGGAYPHAPERWRLGGLTYNEGYIWVVDQLNEKPLRSDIVMIDPFSKEVKKRIIAPSDSLGSVGGGLAYFQAQNKFDADSIIQFVKQYNPNTVVVVGDSPPDLDNLLVAQEIGANLPSDIIERIGITDYFSYWSTIDKIVYVEDNYDLALLASTYSSLINAPLVIQNSELDSENVFENRKVVLVGSVACPRNAVCDEQYTTKEQLQEIYLKFTITDKILISNPRDIQSGVEEEFTTEHQEMIKTLYSTHSLAAPFLASAKHELLITIDQNNWEDVNNQLKTRIKALNMQPKYLTIVAAPNTIDMAYRSIGYDRNGNPVLGSYKERDLAVYGNMDNDEFIELAVGRIFGLTVSDVSSYIARVLFYEDVPHSDNFTMLFQHERGFYNMKAEAKANDVLLSAAGFNKQSVYTDDDVRGFDVKNDMENKFYVNYFDHGFATGWWGGGGSRANISTQNLNENKVWLNPSMVIGEACSTCDFGNIDNKKDLFCSNIIRRGGLGYVGAVDLTSVDDDISVAILDQILNGNSFGEAIKAYKNNFARFNKYFTVPNVEEEFVLIGDPTFNFNLSYPLVEKIEVSFEEADPLSKVIINIPSARKNIHFAVGDENYDVFELLPGGILIKNSKFVRERSGIKQNYYEVDYLTNFALPGFRIRSIPKVEYYSAGQNTILSDNGQPAPFPLVPGGIRNQYSFDDLSDHVTFTVALTNDDNNYYVAVREEHNMDDIMLDEIPPYYFTIYLELEEIT